MLIGSSRSRLEEQGGVGSFGGIDRFGIHGRSGDITGEMVTEASLGASGDGTTLRVSQEELIDHLCHETTCARLFNRGIKAVDVENVNLSGEGYEGDADGEGKTDI
jgi:hypothetical protein